MSRRIVRGSALMALTIALLLGAGAREGLTTDTFTTYRGTSPRLPVAFEYPADWESEESSGTTERYTQVQLYAPAALESRLRVYLVVRAIPAKDAGGRYADVREMAEEYRRHAIPSLRMTEEEQTTVLGAPATRLAVDGTMLLPWNSPKAQPVPVTGQRVFFEQHGVFYELGWMATPETDAAARAAFAHLLDTLTPAG